MNEYTPHTEIVRARYHLATIGDDTPDFIIEMGQSHNYAEFDRWLRKVQSEAWEEGHRCDYIFDEDHVRFCGNPYL